MSNPAMPGFLKICCSSKEPKRDRVRELSRETGVPTPFKVEYQALVDDELKEEAKLHQYFASNRVSGKEFFTGVDPSEIIGVAHRLCQIKYEDNFFVSPEEQKAKEAKAKCREADELRRKQAAQEKVEIENAEKKKQEKQLRRQQAEEDRKDLYWLIPLLLAAGAYGVWYYNEYPAQASSTFGRFAVFAIVGGILTAVARLTGSFVSAFLFVAFLVASLNFFG
jgi:hypothetical protein